MQKDSQTVRKHHLISVNIFRVLLIGSIIRTQKQLVENERRKAKREKVCIYMDVSRILLAGESLWAFQ